MSPRLLLISALMLGACQNGWGRQVGTNIEPGKDVLKVAARDLTGPEQSALEKNGLVVMGADPVQSFHVGYTALFHAHSPVYVTADSMLYAWHSSYDKILSTIERESLIPALETMLDGLRKRLATVEGKRAVRADLDEYLAVALSLLKGQVQPPVAGGSREAIAMIFDHGVRAEGLELHLFGAPASFDFSMLKPRGHYEDQPLMQQYFRAMSWLGRAEVAIGKRTGPGSPWQINQRALGAAVLLGELFDTDLRAKWELFDRTIGALVGPADSMSLPGLAKGLANLGPAEGKSDDQIGAAFEGISVQKIRTQLMKEGEGTIAFLLLGQRYVFDSSVLGDLVAGSIDTSPPRLMPTPVDVGYAVFHNAAADGLLKTERMRYGAGYADALARKAREPLPDDSVAHMWLGALREISPDAKRDAKLPAPLASEPFSRRMLQTQLASWAELRHDNLLYTKQSYTVELGCEYPSAYIDPYPAFYAKLGAMATRVRATVAALPGNPRGVQEVDHYLAGMAKTMARLTAIAERERANEPMTDDDLQWIDHMVSLDGRNAVCTTTIDPKGWYAELYYDQKSALWHDPVIADVHTQPTDEVGNPVGKVLHVGTGMPRFMEITIQHDGGAHTQTYRGLVSSYGELVTEDFQRLTDSEWKERIKDGPIGTPAWLKGIVVGR